MANEELIKKCETGDIYDNDVATSCNLLLNNAKETDEELSIEKEKIEKYLDMIQSLGPKELKEVLQLAMDIESNNDIKDNDLKIEASKLIRAIQLS